MVQGGSTILADTGLIQVPQGLGSQLQYLLI